MCLCGIIIYILKYIQGVKMKVNKMIYIDYECIKQMEKLSKLHANNGQKIGISKIIEEAWIEMVEKLKEEGIDLTKD